VYNPQQNQRNEQFLKISRNIAVLYSIVEHNQTLTANYIKITDYIKISVILYRFITFIFLQPTNSSFIAITIST
jgi:hypothetical protein